MYFKSTYNSSLVYPETWYGEYGFAPAATIFLYNDEEGFCVGTITESMEDFRTRMISEYYTLCEQQEKTPIEYTVEFTLPETFEYITEEQANTLINAADNNNPLIFKGEKLTNRWL